MILPYCHCSLIVSLFHTIFSSFVSLSRTNEYETRYHKTPFSICQKFPIVCSIFIILKFLILNCGKIQNQAHCKSQNAIVIHLYSTYFTIFKCLKSHVFNFIPFTGCGAVRCSTQVKHFSKF